MLKGLQNLVCIGIINLMICTFIRSISSDSVAGIYVSILFCTFFLGLIPARIASKKEEIFFYGGYMEKYCLLLQRFMR